MRSKIQPRVRNLGLFSYILESLFNDGTGFLTVTVFCMGKVCDHGTASFAFLNEGDTGLEFRKHGSWGKLILTHISTCFIHRDRIQEFLVIFAKVQTYFFYAGKDHQCVCAKFFCKKSGCKVFLNDGAGTVQINALLYFQIVDPFKAVYEINNLPNAIEKLTQTTLRNIIGEMELDQTLTSRDTVNTKLRAVLDDATNKWGIKVNRVELQDITPPESVLSAMEKQMQAERNKRAAILTSEGEKQSQILQSEGDKAAMINRAEAQKQQAILEAEGVATARIRVAEAEAVAIKKITEAVGDCTNPANYLLAQKYIQMMEELAKGDKTKTVYLPYEATNVMGSLGGIKELFKGQ